MGSRGSSSTLREPVIPDNSSWIGSYITESDANLTFQDKIVLRGYGDTFYGAINRDLRRNKSSSIDGLADARDIRTIDSIMNRNTSRIPEDTVLYRMIESGAMPLTEGAVIKDKGYVSTSHTINGIRPYQDGIVLRIKVPKGTKGIPMENITGSPAEKEILLHRNINFKVLSSETIKGQKYTNLEVIE
jgi:hypothetical protein